jgi:hypothetical protein
MDLSIPAAGMSSASAAFDFAASAITQAFNNTGNSSSSSSATGDSVDLSTAVAGLLKSKLDFMANVNLEIVENHMNQSTFSVLA